MAELGKRTTNDDIRALISELLEDEGEGPRVEALRDVLNFVDWCDNAEYIREDYFFDGFAEDLADNFGPVRGWPYEYIDWGRATQALAMDYKAVDIDGDTYYVRS